MQFDLKKIAKDIRFYLINNGYEKSVKVRVSKETIIIDNLPAMTYASEIAKLATGFEFEGYGFSMVKPVDKTRIKVSEATQGTKVRLKDSYIPSSLSKKEYKDYLNTHPYILIAEEQVYNDHFGYYVRVTTEDNTLITEFFYLNELELVN